MIYFLKIVSFMEMLQLVALGLFRSCLRPRYRDILTTGDVLLVVIIPLVGMFGLNKHVFYGFMLLMPLLWAGKPTQLAKRYVLALVLCPILAEVYQVGGVYLGTWSAPNSLNVGALVALAMTRRGRLRPVRAIDAALWGIFIVTLLMSARGVALGGVTRYAVTTFLLVVPPYFIIARAIATREAAVDTVSFIVLGGVCNAVVGIFESLRHWPLYESFNDALHVSLTGFMSASLSMRAGIMRAGGAVGNYEALGVITGIALLAALSIRQRFTAMGFWVIVAVLTGGLFLSQARSAWIATLIALALQAIYERRWKRVGIMVGGFGLAAAAMGFSSSNGLVGQLLGKSGHGAETAEYRQNLLNRSLEEAQRHPLTGQTLDQLQVSMNDMRQGEHIIDFVNTHLTVMLVGGVGALLLWLFAWGVPLSIGWRRRGRRVASSPPALSFAALVLIFIFLIFTSPIDRILSLAAIAMGLMSVGVRLPAEADGAPVRPRPRAKRHRAGPLPVSVLTRPADTA